MLLYFLYFSESMPYKFCRSQLRGREFGILLCSCDLTIQYMFSLGPWPQLNLWFCPAKGDVGLPCGSVWPMKCV